MKKVFHKKILIGLLALALLGLPVFTANVAAFGLGDILKVGGIGFIVDRMATPLNNFINGLMAKQGVGTEYATKVVPIITVGSGGYIGAAQVTGDADLVAQTEAVLQLEGNFNGAQFRVKGLIPINSKNPLHFSRVQGVGISAIIDVRI
ncbi:MAG: hypothetical protein E6713_13315 [Sporomusaceae bacterium]|nr:hypothetical protein [Sporomusaceae bacterium]